MFRVIEYFARSLKVIENGRLPLELFGTVSYSTCAETMVVSLAVSTQHANATDGQTPHDDIGRDIARQKK